MSGPIAITSLSPSVEPAQDAHIRAVVTLVWPYSSSTGHCAVLLAEPDFRLRVRNGQIRVRFAGACADAVTKSGIGIGDEVLLRLSGSTWVQSSTTTVSTPGKSVDGELQFRNQLRLDIVNKDPASTVRVQVAELHTEPRHDAQISSTPARSKSLDLPTNDSSVVPSYHSPAFVKNISGEHFTDAVFDPFTDDNLDRQHLPRKKRKIQWHYLHNPPSPISEVLDDSTDVLDAQTHHGYEETDVDEPATASHEDFGFGQDVDDGTMTPTRLRHARLSVTAPSRGESATDGPQLQSSKPQLSTNTDDGRSDRSIDGADQGVASAFHPSLGRSRASLTASEIQRVGRVASPEHYLERDGEQVVSSALSVDGSSGGYVQASPISPANEASPFPFQYTPVQHETASAASPSTEEGDSGSSLQSDAQAGDIDKRTRDSRHEVPEVLLQSPAMHAIASTEQLVVESQTATLPVVKWSLHDPQSIADAVISGTLASTEIISRAEETAPDTSITTPQGQPFVQTGNDGASAMSPTPSGVAEPTLEGNTTSQGGSRPSIGNSVTDDSLDEGSNLTAESGAKPDSSISIADRPALFPAFEYSSAVDNSSQSLEAEREVIEGISGTDIASGSPTIGYGTAVSLASAVPEVPVQGAHIVTEANSLEFDTLSQHITTLGPPHLVAVPDAPKINEQGAMAHPIELTSLILDRPSIQDESEAGGIHAVEPPTAAAGAGSGGADARPNSGQDVEARNQSQARQSVDSDDFHGDQEHAERVSTAEQPDLTPHPRPLTMAPLPDSTPMQDRSADELKEELGHIGPAAKTYMSLFTPKQPPAARTATSTAKKPHAHAAALSHMPDTVSSWFSPLRSVSSVAKSRDNHIKDKNVAKSASPEGREARVHKRHLSKSGIATVYSYFTPLSHLDERLNPPSQSYGSNTVDVLAVVASDPKAPERANAGPRDYFTILSAIDPSLEDHDGPRNVKVEVYRPWHAQLPIANAGDVIMLREFAVRSRKGHPYLLSTNSSSWCVWRYAENAPENTEAKDVEHWAHRLRNGSMSGVREEVKGPPIEYGEEERVRAEELHGWWQGLHDLEMERSASTHGV